MKEHISTVWKMSTAGFGAFFGFLFGGWSHLLQFLLITSIVDYTSGIMAAGANGELKSKVGFRGIAKKVMMFLIVILAAQLDIAIAEQGIDLHLLGFSASVRDATIIFYLSNELLSVVENAGRMGVKLPDPVMNAVEVLKGRNKKKESKGEDVQ
ncbi:phage holin family protein [Bacillus sp. OTU530]|uniref:phage holin family protein n=1 Tax=Bacillus sp. OTU530 TaxID=3043862 RepID=UPI00313E8E7F